MSNQPTVYINFIAGVNDKTSGLLIYLLTEQLRAGTKSFRINISSSGGTIFQAVAIHNFISGLRDVSVHTHNLGQIDSSANLIFLSGQRRTASKSSTFLLHPPQMNIQGPVAYPIEQLQEMINSLINDKEKIAEIIATKIGKSKEEVLRMSDERKPISTEQAKTLGFIHDVEEFVASPGLPIFSITNQT
jgi:ATP-dependent protease ClpP protease subunit